MPRLSHTRTHTTYFDSEKLEAIDKLVLELTDEWYERAAYLSSHAQGYTDVVASGNTRAQLLLSAVRVAKDFAD